MKKILTSLLSFYFFLTFAQKREMVVQFSKQNFDKTIEIGMEILKSEPDDFETILMMARAENERGNHKSALPFLEKARMLMKEDWQKSWTLLEIAKNDYSLRNLASAKQNYMQALSITGTTNSTKSIRSFGLLSGLDEFYKTWTVVESQNIIFHFEDGISQKDIDRIVASRQKAFDEINSFFSANLPKKIDFFVWRSIESYNPVLNKNMGFSLPVFSLSHNRYNQTPGHEISHNISFWRSRTTARTAFINEGIGVHFDQQKDDKLKIAKDVYKTNPVDIQEIWQNNRTTDDNVLYPMAGAFVGYLIDYDKEKFLELSKNKTYDHARKIYEGRIDEIIEEFTLKLQR